VKLDAHPAPTAGPGDHELEILKAKQEKPAAPADGDGPGEVETLKAKLAGDAAPAEDDTSTLKIKRRKAPGVEAPSEVEALKSKLAGKAVAATTETMTRSQVEAEPVEPARRSRLPREAAGTMPTVTVELHRKAPSAEQRRRPLFDLAFLLVLGLWGIACAVALTAGTQWWLFVLSLAATTAVLLFALWESTAFGQESREK
jgi:hypothetical protein